MNKVSVEYYLRQLKTLKKSRVCTKLSLKTNDSLSEILYQTIIAPERQRENSLEIERVERLTPSGEYLYMI
jgi:hypothetical protein